MNDAIREDTGIEAKRSFTTSDGREIGLHGLRLGGLFRVLAAVREQRLVLPDEALDSAALATNGITDPAEQQAALTANMAIRLDAVMRWVFASEQLVPLAIGCFCEMTAEEIAKLELTDVLGLAMAAMDLVEIPKLATLLQSFFSKAGAAFKQVAQAMPKTDRPSTTGHSG